MNWLWYMDAHLPANTALLVTAACKRIRLAGEVTGSHCPPSLLQEVSELDRNSALPANAALIHYCSL